MHMMFYRHCANMVVHMQIAFTVETQFVIEKDNLNFENFDQLLPKLHLCGINFLLEIFACRL